MRNLVLFSILLLAINSSAQDKPHAFKPFRLDFALSAGMPFDNVLKKSIGIAIEPKYAFNDHFAAGLRFEGIDLGPSDEVMGYVGDFKFTTSWLLTTDYYFNTKKFRPFIGAGAGLYNLPEEEFRGSSKLDPVRQFGFMARTGFEIGYFRTSVEINKAGKSKYADYNYLSLKAGFYLWGMRNHYY
jgi:hypothetical protein